MSEIDVDEPVVRTLMQEVRRYLAAVEAFRAEGHEPHWAPEVPRARRSQPRRRAIASRAV